MFENEHFLIVDKRCGYLSVPSRLKEKDPRPCELTFWTKEKGIRLWAVHRLDEEVSGVLVFAKDAEAHRVANIWFEKKTIRKTYEALTEPAGQNFSKNEKQVWKSLLLRGKKRAFERDYGKEAITEATYLRDVQLDQRFYSLWELSPITGRSHQLRFEMAKRGFPILGDELYGSQEKLNVSNRIALRAIRVDLTACPEREKYGLPEKLEVTPLLNWFKELQSL